MKPAAPLTPIRDTQLSSSDFAQAGGLRGAIDGQAEDLFKSFPTEERAAIQTLFQGVTERGEGERPIRHPEVLDHLQSLTGLSADRLTQIVNAFVGNRLLVKRTLENGKTEIDLPHECVTWKWGSLKGWIEEEARAAKSLQFWLQSEGNRQPLVGSSLAEAEKMRSSGRLTGPWAKRYLSDPDAGKLNAWIAESATREQAEQERLRRDRRRAIVTAVAAGLVALLVGGLAIWSFQQKSAADAAQ